MTAPSLDDSLAVAHHSGGSAAAVDRYSRVAIGLHWAIAGFIIFNLGIGFFMESWPLPIRMFAVMLHASSGMTVLALTSARVVWRLLNEPPPSPAGTQRWERHTAHVAHFLLYVAMVLMPLSGWAILSAHPPPGSRGAAVAFANMPGAPSGISRGAGAAGGASRRPAGPPPTLKMWNLVPMPPIAPIEAIGQDPGGVAPQHRLHQDFVEWHSVGAFLLLGLLILHVAGALKHQFIDKQSEFARMGLGRRQQL